MLHVHVCQFKNKMATFFGHLPEFKSDSESLGDSQSHCLGLEEDMM